MHTARQLAQEQFEIAIDGRPATRDELLVEWGPLHRLGVIVHEPFGAVGGSFLLQLAITAFYDARPRRRSREAPIYPDIFAFHVGGRHGDFINYDFFPARKQIFVADEPREILGAINDRGVTHLLVPERPVDRVQHEFKEPAQAIDRIVAAWAYSPSGRVGDADVEITGTAPAVEANTKVTLNSPDAFRERQRALALVGEVVIPDDELALVPEDRAGEVPDPVRDRVWEGREALRVEGGWTETYRRIAVGEALGMLHAGDAPAFREQPDFMAAFEA